MTSAFRKHLKEHPRAKILKKKWSEKNGANRKIKPAKNGENDKKLNAMPMNKNAITSFKTT